MARDRRTVPDHVCALQDYTESRPMESLGTPRGWTWEKMHRCEFTLVNFLLHCTRKPLNFGG